MRNIIIAPQSSVTWENQLTIGINFISSNDAEEQHVMHSRGNNIKVTFYNIANEVAGELFDSFCSRYQENLETPMIRSGFIVYVVHEIYFKVHKVNFGRCGSYIYSWDLIKKKDVTINPKEEDHKYFQYALTVVLSYGEMNRIQKEFQRLNHL